MPCASLPLAAGRWLAQLMRREVESRCERGEQGLSLVLQRLEELAPAEQLCNEVRR
jgi:hypothetical protein